MRIEWIHIWFFSVNTKHSELRETILIQNYLGTCGKHDQVLRLVYHKI